MAFPATYNISYYSGDTYQFIIKPKNSDGSSFNIASTIYTPKFYISTSRNGLSTATLEANAVISSAAYSIVGKVLTSNVATLATSTTHNYLAGDSVSISGVDSTFNGNYTITAIPSTTSFSYAKTATDVISAAVSPVGSVVSLTNTSTNTIVCTIPSSIGSQLVGGTTYVYDVSILRDSGSISYTLLTGSISVTDDITAAV